jgi:uncharacterized OB-fold protein
MQKISRIRPDLQTKKERNKTMVIACNDTGYTYYGGQVMNPKLNVESDAPPKWSKRIVLRRPGKVISVTSPNIKPAEKEKAA